MAAKLARSLLAWVALSSQASPSALVRAPLVSGLLAAAFMPLLGAIARMS